MPLPLAARANGGPTVSDLAERYLEQHVEVRLKPRTRQGVRGALRNHILPALGRMPVAAVERRHVIDLQQSMSAYPVAANRALKVLSHMYRLAGLAGAVGHGQRDRDLERVRRRVRQRLQLCGGLGGDFQNVADDASGSPSPLGPAADKGYRGVVLRRPRSEGASGSVIPDPDLRSHTGVGRGPTKFKFRMERAPRGVGAEALQTSLVPIPSTVNFAQAQLRWSARHECSSSIEYSTANTLVELA